MELSIPCCSSALKIPPVPARLKLPAAFTAAPSHHRLSYAISSRIGIFQQELTYLHRSPTTAQRLQFRLPYCSVRMAAAAVAAGMTSSILRVKASSSTYSQSRRVRRPQNVDGDLFVDNTCIDCDTCRWMAPDIFNRQDGMSAVFKQPNCHEERITALQALLSCPTNSIHTEQPPRDIVAAHKTFPIPIDEHKIQGVYHCGYHSEKSYGATSYFIQRPEGNILIDSPRYTERLASNIKKMGGARFMFLTHKDDIADHDKWSKELGCSRILHSEEVRDSTADVEIKLEGNGPWTLGSDVTLIHTPGHTEVSRFC